MIREHLPNILTSGAIIGIIGFLCLLMMRYSGCDSSLIAAAVVLIILFFFAICMLIVYSDRIGFIKKYQSKNLSTVDSDDFVSAYRSTWVVKIVIFLVLVALIIVLSLLTLYLHQDWVDFNGMIGIIVDRINGVTYPRGDPRLYADILILDDRLPHVICSIAAGASLAVGGCVMQSVVKNPLADPYTTGISSGAVLGVAFAMIVGFTVSNGGQMGVVINAFVFGLIPTGIMIAMARISNGSVVTIILVGTALSYIFASITTVLMIGADETQMDQVFKWQVGSLAGMTWTSAITMTTFFVLFASVLVLMANKLNIMSAGDSQAKSLGMNVERFRALCMIILSFMTAATISFTGIIGFLGLICPHIVRLLVGSDNRAVIPIAAALGAAILMFADFVGRNIAEDIVPVGVVMSFIGAPLFLILLLRSKKGVLY